MRIAIVHPYPWPEVRRGAERYLDDLAHYLVTRGHDVEIVTGTHGQKRVEQRSDGAIVYRVPHVRPGPASRFHVSEVETFGLRALGRLVRSRPDVVHAFTPSGALAGTVARRPTLYTVLGHPDRAQLPTSKLLRQLFLRAARNATVTAVLSRASATALLGTAGRRAIVLPPGVRLERFEPNLEPRKGPPRLLFSATLADRRKRADLAVSALALLLELHPQARLSLSGEGDPAWVLEIAHRLGDHVRAAIDVLGPGNPEDVPARYREATLTLLPAEHEAFGLALVESLASGTPVVCVRSGGMPDIVLNGATRPTSDQIDESAVGAVADAMNPSAVSEAAQKVLSIASEADTPRRCVERAARWSWEQSVGPAHERAYELMAAGASRSSRLPDLSDCWGTLRSGVDAGAIGGWR